MGKFGLLVVQPLTARLYRDVQTFGKMDPYVVIKIGDKSAKSSVHKDAGKFPSWKDQLSIKTNGKDSCQIQIWDKNSFSKDKLAYQKEYSKWITLQHKGKKAAQINCNFKFLTQTQQISYQAVTCIAHGQPIPIMPPQQPPHAAAQHIAPLLPPHGAAAAAPYNVLQSPVYHGFAQTTASPAFYPSYSYGQVNPSYPPGPPLAPPHSGSMYAAAGASPSQPPYPQQQQIYPSQQQQPLYPDPMIQSGGPAQGFIPHSQSMHLPQSGAAYGSDYIPPPPGSFGPPQPPQPPYGGASGSMYTPSSHYQPLQ